MRNEYTFSILTLALIVSMSAMVPAAAAQQDSFRRGSQGHQHPKPAIDRALDTDGDEMISADEIAQASSVLPELDTDGDGVLSFSECMGFSTSDGARQAPQSGRGGSGGRPPEPPIFSALDSSGDQVVDESEIAEAASALIELDDNGDGRLDPDECRPSPPSDRRGEEKRQR